MPQIKAEKLTFAYPGSYDNIFENLNLQLDSSWKLGLIGRNGRGKTTLLRLLQGGMEYSGTLSCPLPTAYFPYPVNRWHARDGINTERLLRVFGEDFSEYMTDKRS